MEEVVAITAIHDGAIRNLRITECYHRLSLAMAARTGACANWCTFATWASRQAGRTIRGEDLLARLAARARCGWSISQPIQSVWRALLRKGVFNPETGLGRLVRAIHSPFDAFERASEAVAGGNLKVFREIGFEFARYLESCPAGAAVDSDRFAAFLEPLRDGPPPEGQQFLKRAFLHYQQQGFIADPTARMQLIFLANLEIGLHEQTRLQPEIQGALEVLPVTAEDLGRRALEVLPGGRLLALFRRPLGFLLRPYRRFAAAITRRAVTESLMVLALPDLTLALGRNLDRPLPEVFREITQPDLLEIYSRCEPSGAGCDDCGTEDWADFAQRMHYILHLFRAFHLDASLMGAPFTQAQIRDFAAGRVPEGIL